MRPSVYVIVEVHDKNFRTIASKVLELQAGTVEDLSGMLTESGLGKFVDSTIREAIQVEADSLETTPTEEA